MWDFSGRERFRIIARSYYKTAHLIALVYAVDDRNSFDSIPKLVDEVKEQIENPKFLLVGNKCDLEKERQVPTEEAKTYAAKNEMEFIEVSANAGTNIEKMFDNSLKKILDDMKKEKNNFFEKTEVGNIELNNPEIKNSQDDNNGHKKNDINNKDLSFCDKYCFCCPCLKKTEGNVEE